MSIIHITYVNFLFVIRVLARNKSLLGFFGLGQLRRMAVTRVILQMVSYVGQEIDRFSECWQLSWIYQAIFIGFLVGTIRIGWTLGIWSSQARLTRLESLINKIFFEGPLSPYLVPATDKRDFSWLRMLQMYIRMPICLISQCRSSYQRIFQVLDIQPCRPSWSNGCLVSRTLETYQSRQF